MSTALSALQPGAMRLSPPREEDHTLKSVHATPIACTSVLLLLLGCQHIAPRPLDWSKTADALRTRPIDVEPIMQYAEELAHQNTIAPAGPFNAADGLHLSEALAVALWYNLDLRAARLQVEQTESVARVSGRWPDPELGIAAGKKKSEDGATEIVTFENGLQSASYEREAPDVDRTWISAESLAITIPLSGRLRAEKQLRRTESTVARLRVAEAEWRLLSEVRNAWTQWSAVKERKRLLDEHLGLLSRFAETTRLLADAGELSPGSARLFAIEKMRTEAERARVVQRESESHAALLQLLGLLPDAPLELVPNLQISSPSGIPLPELSTHPVLMSAKAAYQVAEDALRLELRKQYPDLTFSPAYSREEDESSLTLGLGMPVPVWNANRAGIAAAAGARDVAHAKAEAAYLGLMVEVKQAEAALAGCRAQREQLQEAVLPLVDAQLTEALALLDAGEIDIVLLYEILDQVNETKLELLNAVVSESIATTRFIASTATDMTTITTETTH